MLFVVGKSYYRVEGYIRIGYVYGGVFLLGFRGSGFFIGSFIFIL